MSSATLLFVTLLVMSFLFARLSKELRSRWVVYAGLLYLFLGGILGPNVGFGVISKHALGALTPLALLLSGVLGFIIGLRVKQILGRDAAMAGTLTALSVFLLVGVGTLVLVSAVYALTPRQLPDEFLVLANIVFRGQTLRFSVSSQLFWLCLTLAATSAVASSSNIASAQSALGARGKLTGWLVTIARVSEFVTVLAYGLLLSTSRAFETASALGLSITEWAVAATGSGVLCGILFSLFIGREGDETRIYFAAIGAIIFASGIGSALGVSPLFVNLVAGATVAAISSHTARLRSVLENLQGPVFVLLFLLAGAYWMPIRGWAWGLPAAYFLLRVVGLFIFATLYVRHVVEGKPKVARLGEGLIGQDAVPLAVGLTFAVRFPEDSAMVLSAVIGGYVLATLLSSWFLRRLLVDHQELGATK